MTKEEIAVKIVLVKPRNPLNIGAAARAMANFGFRELAVVSPYEPVWRETCSAVGAEDVVASGRMFNSLTEAVAECHLVLGTTSCQRRTPDTRVVRLPDLSEFMEKNYGGQKRLNVALVFGPEKTGLTNKHLARCNAYLNIPTSEDTPSMNLSHSVAVCCYEMSLITGLRTLPIHEPQEGIMPTADELNAAVSEMETLFEKTGFQAGSNPEARMEAAQKFICNLDMTRAQLVFLKSILTRCLKTENNAGS